MNEIECERNSETETTPSTSKLEEELTVKTNVSYSYACKENLTMLPSFNTWVKALICFVDDKVRSM